MYSGYSYTDKEARENMAAYRRITQKAIDRERKIRELRKTIELGHLLPCIGAMDDYHEECDCGLLDAEVELEEIYD